MCTYTLRMNFTNDDLERFLASGSKVVMARPGDTGEAPNVAWIVYRAMSENTVTWRDEYGVYACGADLVNGALLTPVARTSVPSVEGLVYTLNPSGGFGEGVSGGEPRSFGARNLYDNRDDGRGYLLFGLRQSATVNGRESPFTAISAAPLLYQSTAAMRPASFEVWLWVQAHVQGNSVVTTVTSPQSIVRFGGSMVTVSLRYDSVSGRFVGTDGDTSGDGVTIDYVEPAVS